MGFEVVERALKIGALEGRETVRTGALLGGLLDEGTGAAGDVCPLIAISISAAADVAAGLPEVTLPLKTGRERSNELRGTMLMEPASAEPGESGVGESDTSMRETLLRLNMPTSTCRPVSLLDGRLMPARVIGVFSAGAPSIETVRIGERDEGSAFDADAGVFRDGTAARVEDTTFDHAGGRGSGSRGKRPGKQGQG